MSYTDGTGDCLLKYEWHHLLKAEILNTDFDNILKRKVLHNLYKNNTFAIKIVTCGSLETF